MPLTDTAGSVERNRFFNGQRLFASDLDAIDALHRQMRWLHNQSLHQPGIGSGFAITGKKGDRQVTIQSGYAIDSSGREIVLAETVVEPVPPVANDGYGGAVYFDLTVSYPDEKLLKASETRDGICLPGGAIRLREIPVFCWVRLGPPPDRLPIDPVLSADLQNGRRLRLARAQVLNCQLDRPLSLAQRRNARPSEQPYVACGRAEEPAWTLPAGPKALGVGLQLTTTVDTSAAGFRTTPCCTAHLVGDRVFRFEVGSRTVQRVLDGFVTLLNPGPAGFTFSILIPDTLFTRQPESESDPDPRTASDFEEQLMNQIAKKKWTVEWMGAEG
ncbi:MAG: hypothetical protein R2762_02780 [Bryobacteraceae bacterium]